MSLSPKIFFVGAITLVVAAAIIAGLFLAGSPAQERMRRADEQRVNDLQSITYAMDGYVTREHVFPPSLDALAKSRDVYVQGIQDPRTQTPYEFRATGTNTYELCATFETASALTEPMSSLARTPANGFWDHGIGRTCYALDIRVSPGMLEPKTFRTD